MHAPTKNRLSFLCRPSCAPHHIEWNTTVGLPYCIWIHSFAFCIPRRQLLFHASHACVPTHVFMSFEDFFGDQDTFVSDQTSPPPLQTRVEFFPPRHAFNRFVEKIRPRGEGQPVWTQFPTRRICTMVDLRTLLGFTENRTSISVWHRANPRCPWFMDLVIETDKQQ